MILDYLIQHLDLGIVALFLLINLIVGLSFSRSTKDIKEYALGGKNFSTPALVATIVSTGTSGGTMFVILENIYKDGLYFGMALLGKFFGRLLTGRLATRMAEFLNNVSVAEAMGTMYGKTVQVITAVSGILGKTGFVAIQFNVISKILSTLFDLDSTASTFVAASIVVMYSALGGVRAVTFTDILQFFTFGTILPILALTIWNKLHDPAQIVVSLGNNPVFDIKKVLGFNPKLMQTLGLLVYLALPIGGGAPEIFQRIAMARDVQQVRQAFTYSAFILLLIFMLTAWMSVLLLTEKPGLASGQVVPYLISQHTHEGLKGLLAVCVMALSMSTADSCLNTCSVLFSNDVVVPLIGSNNSSVRIAKSFSFVVGLFALLVALYNKDLLKLILFSGSIYMPVYTVPLIIAVLGFRTTPRVVLISMAAGFTTLVLWSIYFGNSGSVVPGMLANLVALLGSHYLLREKGGWKTPDPKSPLALERAARKRARQRRREAIENFRLVPYLKANLPEQVYLYAAFGFYSLAALSVTFYALRSSHIEGLDTFYGRVLAVSLTGTSVFLTLPAWSDAIKNKSLLAFFWPLTVGFLLFFAGTLLAIIGQFHPTLVTVLMGNLLVAILLLRWPLALVVALIGTGLAVLFFKQSTGLPVMPSGFQNVQMGLGHMLLFASALFIALIRSREAFRQLENENIRLQLARKVTNEELIEAFHHRGHMAQEARESTMNVLNTVQRLRNQLGEGLAGLETTPSSAAMHQVLQTINDKLRALIAYFHQTIYQFKDALCLEVDVLSTKALNHEIFDILDEQYPGISARLYVRDNAQKQDLRVDVDKLKQLIVNGLRYADQQSPNGQAITWGIHNTLLGYPITSIQGHIKEVQAVCFTITTQNMLPTTRTLYIGNVDKEVARLAQSEAELPLTYNQRIVDAHYGTSELIAGEEGIVTQIYVIPLHVREVRPKTMDLPPRQEAVLGATIHPEEEAFVKEVQNKTSINPALLQRALEIAKQSHTERIRTLGESFSLPPIATAHILLGYTQDEDALLAALLHDAVEGSWLSLTQVALFFNPAVQRIVDGVIQLNSHLATIQREDSSIHENMEQLLNESDPRVLQVKLADRLHYMRTIEGHLSLDKQQQITEETQQFFVPIAKHLGLQAVEKELSEIVLSRCSG
ncbi:MAG: HD domain-containing protein [Roseivirga sp.]